MVLRAFFGHHKTASTWVRIILNDVSAALDLDQRTIHTAANFAPHASVREMVDAEHPDLITITNPRREVLDSLPATMRGFHVIRDPRDIIISAYFSHLHSHPISFGGVEWPELAVHREKLQKLDHDEGIFQEIEFTGALIDHMSTWDYYRPGMLEVKMEDLVAEPVVWWTRIFAHLELLTRVDGPFALQRVVWNLAPRRGIPKSAVWLRGRAKVPRIPMRRLPAAYVPWMLERYSFARLSGGRTPGDEDITSHYRRGVAGDWTNHLTEKHLDAIRDRFGDLVERLGYE
jgi:hypothetical protein